ncbi:hypothetical protein BDP27DRAFT_1323362 [Rhodocollybia butyracea]|uniref:Uncharacterized protein n=1 Tax=Rhodocollybia butyracea TaxID=206335 RepID=A0A9P5PRA0_9AGAR|nr:hypothetical protein BDP27DRAFT_1323362 [Rhodocollybia butyracea]
MIYSFANPLRTLQRTLRLQRNITKVQSVDPRIATNLVPQSASHIAALPAVPPRLQVRPTPWLSPEEMKTYLLSVRDLLPWDCRPLKKFIPGMGVGLTIWGNYRFSDESGAEQFMEQVQSTADEEQNDILLEMKKISSRGSEEDLEHLYHVRIKTITEDAFLPNSISNYRSNFLPAETAIPFPETLIIPGVTIRDVRFVLLVDQLFRDHFLSTSSTQFSNTGIISLVHSPENLFSDTVESVVRQIFLRGFCQCCGLLHTVADCTVRKDYPPAHCMICSGHGHWSMDCSSRSGAAS